LYMFFRKSLYAMKRAADGGGHRANGVGVAA
jgi:hypothetical protein